TVALSDSRRSATRSHSRWQRLDKLAGCLVVAVVAQLILILSCRVFALTRLVAVVSALALALILGHRFLSNTLNREILYTQSQSSMSLDISSGTFVRTITNFPVPKAPEIPTCAPPAKLSHITATNHASPLNATSTACNPAVRK